jgi:DNA-binding transcriptional ArsR family regulator
VERVAIQVVERGDACEVRMVDPERVDQGRGLLLDDDVYFELAETFRALADSSRAKIVYSLLQQELCVCDLAAVVGMSESAVSQHLRVLRNLRLVKTRRDGKLMYYALDDAHVRRLLDVSLNHLAEQGRIGPPASTILPPNPPAPFPKGEGETDGDEAPLPKREGELAG